MSNQEQITKCLYEVEQAELDGDNKRRLLHLNRLAAMQHPVRMHGGVSIKRPRSLDQWRLEDK